MIDVKVGDRIRTTYINEGAVTEVSAGGTISFGSGCYLTPGEVERGEAAIEILERAKPKWQDGDVAVFLGNPRFYLGGKWYTPDGPYCGGSPQTHEYKLIMRDGKPVA